MEKISLAITIVIVSAKHVKGEELFDGVLCSQTFIFQAKNWGVFWTSSLTREREWVQIEGNRSQIEEAQARHECEWLC